jgi:transcription elongation factor GreA
MADKYPMTPRGQQRMKDELKRLKEVARPANVLAIEEARAHGDLSENAEYHAAKEQQSHIAGRITDLETKLALSEVIDPARLSGTRVVFGATVTVADAETDEQTTYTIVGDDEADIKQGLISISAPMTRAMIGREVGDTARIRSPGGQREVEIVAIKFQPLV